MCIQLNKKLQMEYKCVRPPPAQVRLASCGGCSEGRAVGRVQWDRGFGVAVLASYIVQCATRC